MKTKFLIAILVISAFARAYAAQEPQGPRIAVKELRYDIGKIKQGLLASHIFEVRNAGDQTLVIERIQPG